MSTFGRLTLAGAGWKWLLTVASATEQSAPSSPSLTDSSPPVKCSVPSSFCLFLFPGGHSETPRRPDRRTLLRIPSVLRMWVHFPDHLTVLTPFSPFHLEFAACGRPDTHACTPTLVGCIVIDTKRRGHCWRICPQLCRADQCIARVDRVSSGTGRATVSFRVRFGAVSGLVVCVRDACPEVEVEGSPRGKKSAGTPLPAAPLPAFHSIVPSVQQRDSQPSFPPVPLLLLLSDRLDS